MKIVKAENYSEASRIAAELVAEQMLKKPESVLGFATGSTPEGLYAALVEMNKAGKIDFSGITTFNLDEYYRIDPQNDQSYRYFMQKHLFDHINVRPEKTFVPDGTAADPRGFGLEYDRMIEECGGIDLQILGIGNNGHIGFNEPADSFVAPTHLVQLTKNTIEANSRFFEKEEDVPKQAITMGMKSIMQAKKIVMLVTSEKKKEILEKSVNGPITPWVPASILQLHPDVTVIYDF